MKRFKILLALALCLTMITSMTVFVHGATQSITSLLGYQLTEADADGAYSLRLVGVINATATDLDSYDGVGFDVTMTFADHTDWAVQTGSFTRKTVYSTIYADGVSCSPTDMNLTDGYFFLLPINGLYENVGSLKLTVTTFYVKNGAKASGTEQTVTVSKTANTEKPVFTPSGAQVTYSEYDLGDGAYEYAYAGVSNSTYSNLISQITSAGYTAYDTNEIDGNLFATYTKGYMQINTAYYSNYSSGGYTGALKVVYSPKGYLPQTSSPTYEKVTDAKVIQFGTKSSTYSAPGECYVIQLEDGSFVVIDGGGAYPGSINDDISALMNYLTENKPASHEKPHVTWMITHAHGDHIGVPLRFLNTYSDRITLDMICYNFPLITNNSFVHDDDANTLKYPGELKEILDTKYPNATRYIFHTGQVLYLAGCKIEFLHTHEDLYPVTMDTLNKTSATWKMTFKATDEDTEYTGNSFLVLGDSEQENCNFMAAVYSEALDCDMVQASHHGLNGGTSALYQKITPSIVFWPIDSSRSIKNSEKDDIWENEANRAWLTDSSIRHYYGDVTTVILANNLQIKNALWIMEEPFDGFNEDSDQDMVWDWGV